MRPAGGRIFIEGPAGSGKTSAAVAYMQQMLANGVPGESLLVLVPQRTLAAPYDQALRRPGNYSGGVVSLMTIGGLAQRMLNLFWPLISEAAGFARPDSLPIFLTLETAQYYMARLARPLLDDQRLFDSVTLDRNRLFSQVLDNLNKAAVVGFSYTQIAERLKSAWVGEPGQLHVYEDVQICANLFREYCLQHNLLDFSLQIESFYKYLWPLSACQNYLQQIFRHLIYDNIEEDAPIAHDVLQLWLPEFDSALLVYDREAGYRRFLGADPESAYRLKDLCTESIVFKEQLVSSFTIQVFEARLSSALLAGGMPLQREKAETDLDISVLLDSVDAEAYSADQKSKSIYLKSARFFPQLLDWVASSISSLVLNDGIPPGEIVVLTPYLSDALRFSLTERLATRGIATRSHRPSRSLRDEPATHCLLTLAALAYPGWGLCPSRFDVAYALVQSIENLDLVRAQLLTEIVYRHKGNTPNLTSFDRLRPEMQERITYRLGERFEKLRLWLETAPTAGEEFDHFLSRLFGELLSQPGFGFHDNFDAGQTAANLIESVQKFRWVAEEARVDQDIPLGQEYLTMVQAGVIAAQYLGGWRPRVDDLVLLAPAYTFLLANHPVQVQFWLDVGSRGWSQRLYQPLTHPYVLSRFWLPGRLWTDADEVAAGQESLVRLATGLLRRCRRSVYLGVCDLNEQGYEQRGPLLQALQRLLRQSKRISTVR